MAELLAAGNNELTMMAGTSNHCRTTLRLETHGAAPALSREALGVTDATLAARRRPHRMRAGDGLLRGSQ